MRSAASCYFLPTKRISFYKLYVEEFEFSMRERMKKRGNWRRAICEAFDFLPDVAGVPTVQLIENSKLIAFECYAIDKYSKESILLKADHYSVLVLGECLLAKEYENRRLEISGRIHSVQFIT